MTPDRIGFDRVLRLRWLDQAALSAGETRDPDQLRAALRPRLAAEIAGQEAQLKTTGVLTRAWWRVPVAHEALRDEALAHFVGCAPGDRLFYHWGMLLLAYPLFEQVVTITGRLLRHQGTLRPIQVSQRIAADWGHRTTLETAVPRIVRSLADWETLLAAGEVGVYRAGGPFTSADPAAVLWLLRTRLCAHRSDVPFNDLVRTPALFPFSVQVTPADLRRSPRLQVYQQGQEMTMVHYVG